MSKSAELFFAFWSLSEILLEVMKGNPEGDRAANTEG